MELGHTSSIKTDAGQYVAVHPATEKSFIMQHKQSGMYITCGTNKKERVRFDKDRNKIPTGTFMLENQLQASEQPTDAVLWELDIANGPTLLEFTNSNKLIRTGGSRKEISEGYQPDKPFFPGHMIAKYYQGGYKTEHVNFIEQPDGSYHVQSNTHLEYYLTAKINKKTGRVNMRYEKSDNPDCFILHSKQQNMGKVVEIKINRCTDNVMNDGTSYEIVDTNETIKKPREYYWMVDHYIWEFLPHDDNMIIKLVADDRPDMYLSVQDGNVITSDTPDQWKVSNNTIQHNSTGKYLSISSGVKLTDSPFTIQYKL